MPKVQTALTIEEELMSRVRATAKRMRWTLTDATELAFELFLEKFEKATIPGLAAPEESPEMEKAQC